MDKMSGQSIQEFLMQLTGIVNVFLPHNNLP